MLKLSALLSFYSHCGDFTLINTIDILEWFDHVIYCVDADEIP